MVNSLTSLSSVAPALNPPAEMSAQSSPPISASSTSSSSTSAANDQAPAKSDVRLFIEQDHETHTYVYRLVDSTTGKVLVEIPREQLSTLAAGNPPAGSLIGTTV